MAVVNIWRYGSDGLIHADLGIVVIDPQSQPWIPERRGYTIIEMLPPEDQDFWLAIVGLLD